eukprot:gene830-242_t
MEGYPVTFFSIIKSAIEHSRPKTAPASSCYRNRFPSFDPRDVAREDEVKNGRYIVNKPETVSAPAFRQMKTFHQPVDINRHPHASPSKIASVTSDAFDLLPESAVGEGSCDRANEADKKHVGSLHSPRKGAAAAPVTAWANGNTPQRNDAPKQKRKWFGYNSRSEFLQPILIKLNSFAQHLLVVREFFCGVRNSSIRLDGTSSCVGGCWLRCPWCINNKPDRGLNPRPPGWQTGVIQIHLWVRMRSGSSQLRPSDQNAGTC